MTTRPPMPNTAHPDLERDAPGIRSLVDSRPWGPIIREHVTVADRWEDGVTFHRDRLDIAKAAAPAPYTEERFIYVWEVLTDQHGRTITTDARIDRNPKFEGEILMHGGNV